MFVSKLGAVGNDAELLVRLQVPRDAYALILGQCRRDIRLFGGSTMATGYRGADDPVLAQCVPHCDGPRVALDGTAR